MGARSLFTIDRAPCTTRTNRRTSMTTPQAKAFDDYANYRQNCINIALAIRDRDITTANQKFDQEYADAMTNEANSRKRYDTGNTPTQKVSTL